jgi:SpoVK/Ycf46/Vps4 family AAA+-type ATPase
MPSGTISTIARRAAADCALAGRDVPAACDVLRALRGREVGELERLARRVPAGGEWSDLAVADQTARELELLESRCRHREQLLERVADALAAGLTSGVRALLTGPSGTGKTLAARLLASSLGKDLYALDLSTVVDKYLGETEKNLDAVLTRAEELDVVLLLDEGDALLTRRTDVQTSNDRYANLETNFLLQRLETYEGILLVTTNAGERIDPAFKRRMDVVVEFRAPDAVERWQIWSLHLPADHEVDERLLSEVAARCHLKGGQIRNAALHASLLALRAQRPVGDELLELAVRREYDKAKLVCPLRVPEVLGG